ncbi:hypothetical protein P9112_004390 [Eukaryota sp. TZLM1-RC]
MNVDVLSQGLQGFNYVDSVTSGYSLDVKIVSSTFTDYLYIYTKPLFTCVSDNKSLEHSINLQLSTTFNTSDISQQDAVSVVNVIGEAIANYVGEAFEPFAPSDQELFSSFEIVDCDTFTEFPSDDDFDGDSDFQTSNSTQHLDFVPHLKLLHYQYFLPKEYFKDTISLTLKLPLNQYLSTIQIKIYHLSTVMDVALKLPVSTFAPSLPEVNFLTQQCSVTRIMARRLTTEVRALYKQFKLCSDFFSNIETCVKNSFLHLSDKCAVCDDLLSNYGICPSSKLTYCDKSTCCFSFTDLGVGYNLLDDVLRNQLSVELLLNFALNTVNSRDKERLFDSCPSDFLDINKRPDYKDIYQHLQSIPPISSLSSAESELDLRTTLGTKSFRLLRWVISTNRSLILSIPSNSRYYHSSLQGTQFLVSGVNPKREVEFQNLCSQFGFIWAYHGSCPFNWWRIIGKNEAIINMSGTSGQLHGSAHGPGVYTSITPSTALSYGRSFVTRNEALPSGDAILVCQIAKVCGYEQWMRNNRHYIVVPQTRYVLPRYFVINANSHGSVNGVVPSCFTSEELLSELL